MKWLARATRRTARFVQPLVPREPGGVTILTYHLVGAGTQSPVDIALDVFVSQLNELRAGTEICSLAQAVSHLKNGTPCARPFVALTFDDGFDNFRTHAWPVLAQLQIPCTLYVPVGFMEGTTRAPLTGAGTLRPMAWEALRELASGELLTVGSHSWGHADLRRLGVEELRRDLRLSRERLEERIHKPVNDFCYPQAKWSFSVEAEVRQVYETAVIAGGRRNVAARFHPHRLGRVPIRKDMPTGLEPVVQSTVWLEEWLASHGRALG